MVRLTDGLYAIDKCAAFRHTASGGLFGLIANAASNVMRHQGTGPLIKFVDNFLFAWLPTKCIAKYNDCRASIAAHGGGGVADTCLQGACFWEGSLLESGCCERHAKDYSKIKDLSNSLGRLAKDAGFAYGICNLNHIFKKLGTPWAPHKDQVFAFENTFQGMVWSVKLRYVGLEEATRLWYLGACCTWRKSHTHNLAESQKLAVTPWMTG
jgi:hypothetical protein